MQYQCVQCNEVFTIDAGEDKPRCPKCLRQHGLRPVEGSAPPRRPTRRLFIPIGVVVALGLGAGGYAAYRQAHKHKPGQVPLAPIDADALRQDVRALTGVDLAEFAQLFEADDKLRAFAERAARGAGSPDAKAKAICAALQERKRKQAFVAWSRTEPRDGVPLMASATLVAIQRDAARRELYPLELSGLAVAALRSVGVPALVAEVYRYPNERTALDPTGRLGYHALFVPTAEGSAAGKLYDPYGGRTETPRPGDYAVLNDAQAVGAALTIRAMHKLNNASDAKGGLADSEVAVKLLPSSASARSTRAALLLATGGVESGTSELDAAVQLRNDAVRHNNVALFALATNDPNRAAKEVAIALSELPDYALAHVTLATVHLMRGERDLARSELEQGERLDHDLGLLPQIWAQFYADGNDFAQAITKSEEAVRRRPKDPQGRLVLAQVYRAAGRYDDMRKQAREILQRTPPDEKERLQAVLRALLGPTALDDSTSPSPSDPSGAGPAQPADTLSLSQRPDTPGGPGRPQFGSDPTQAAESGALQLQPGAPRLRLGGTGSKLKLDLNP
jgi:tetratricopeptide (TPR) repeat protein